MDTKTKIALGFIVICIIAIMAYVIKVQRDMLIAVQQNTTEQRFLKDNITAVQASLLTKDEFQKRLDQVNLDMSAIKNDLKNTNSTITSILTISNKTPGYIGTGIGSTGYLPQPPTDPGNPNPPNPPQVCTNGNETCYKDIYGYFTKVPYLKLTEPTSDKQQIPIGQVSFNANAEKPWGVSVLPREYNTTVLLATDPSGRKTAYAKMTIKPDDGSGKVYSLPETQVQFAERLPENQFFWWNPRVFLGIDAGYSSKPGFDYGMTAQVFTSAYGKIKQVPDWQILGLGLNYDINNQKYNIAFTPIAYRVFKDGSLFQNLYVAPTITAGFTGNIAVLGGIRIGL